MSSDAAQTGTTALPRLGRYQLLAKLGAGGMGEVYLARDTQLDREVALKLLPPKSINDPEAVARFQREAKAMAQLSHPNIVQAHDAGEEDGKHFLVMEYVEGTSLDKILQQEGKLLSSRAADYAYQAAQALQHAHAKGLIHRDLKPSNLLVTDEGVVKLLDLGLARFLQDQIADPAETREGTGMGTPDYAAPEQFRDAHNVDARADVYALGCTLYHLLTGKPPFPGSSFREKYEAHAKRQPTPIEELNPEPPGGLAAIVEKMMAKRPKDRIQSAADVVEVLSPFVAGSSPSFAAIRSTAQWQLSGVTTKDWKRPQLRLPWVVASVLFATLLATFLGFVAPGWFRDDAPSAPDDRSAQRKPSDKDQESGADGTGKSTTKAGKKPDGEPKPALLDDPNVLTVSSDERDGGKYRTINAALRAVQPGQVIRVLDDKVYQESLSITSPSRHRGISLESVKSATLELFASRAIITLYDVQDVSISGFRLRVNNAPATVGSLPFAMIVSGDCSGLRIENVVTESPRGVDYVGIQFEQGKRTKKSKPIRVERCVLRDAFYGITFHAVNIPDVKTYVPLPPFIVRNNLIERTKFDGIKLFGSLRDVHVVGNRISRAGVGVQLLYVSEDSENVLVANNSFYECGEAVRLWDTAVKGSKIHVRNNLILAPLLPDFVYLMSKDYSGAPKPGNGKSLHEKWTISHNWREVKPPTGKDDRSLGWVPPTADDVRKDRIDGVNLDAKNPDKYLQPKNDSELAKAGAGQVDASLPNYVGALPPEGVEPWDWDRTWLAPPGTTRLLKVYKDAKKPDYSTINAALADAKPWDTIRVLDDATYRESITLDGRKHSGIALEAMQRATLASNETAVTILNVPHVTIRGFRFRAEKASAYLVIVALRSQGTRLERLDFSCEQAAKSDYVGIDIEQLMLTPQDEPVLVRNCTIRNAGMAVRISGIANDGKTAIPTGQIVVHNNDIVDCDVGVRGSGAVFQCQVLENRFIGNKLSAVHWEVLLEESRDILIANNTMFECGLAFRLWDAEVRGRRLRFANNLVLACDGPDMVHLLGASNETSPRGAGNPGLVRKIWTIDHNWREVSVPMGTTLYEKSWIPPSSTDQRRDKIPILSREREQAGFLRPASSSPLATGGANGELPSYVGAVPPEGMKRWHWGYTWRSRIKQAIAEQKEQSKK